MATVHEVRWEVQGCRQAAQQLRSQLYDFLTANQRHLDEATVALRGSNDPAKMVVFAALQDTSRGLRRAIDDLDRAISACVRYERQL